MHDVAWFEGAGLPSVALVSGEFKAQARYQAQGLGLKDAVQLPPGIAAPTVPSRDVWPDGRLTHTDKED